MLLLAQNLFLPSVVAPIKTLTFTVMNNGVILSSMTFSGTALTYTVH